MIILVPADVVTLEGLEVRGGLLEQVRNLSLLADFLLKALKRWSTSE